MKHKYIALTAITITLITFLTTMQLTPTGNATLEYCKDTDIYQDRYAKGTATTAEKEYEDTCINEQIVLKYYCAGKEIKKEKLLCGFYEKCKDGRCIERTRPEKRIYPTTDEYKDIYREQYAVKPRNIQHSPSLWE